MTRGGAVLKMLTLQNRIHFSRALMPALSVFWVCHFQILLQIVLWLRPKPATIRHAGQFLRPISFERALPQAKLSCAPPRATWNEPPSNLKMAATHFCLDVSPETKLGTELADANRLLVAKQGV